jgi:hypothetical protein
MTPQTFVAKWGKPEGVAGPAYALNEEQGAQSHFLDLCALLNVPEPGSTHPSGLTACPRSSRWG